MVYFGLMILHLLRNKRISSGSPEFRVNIENKCNAKIGKTPKYQIA